jgi:hypothetical protein
LLLDAPLLFREDLILCGVLCTRVALAIGFDSFVVGVRAGAEVSASPRLAITVKPKS